MSVSTLDLPQAITKLREQANDSPTTLNFHQVFGTKGCLLRCKQRERAQRLPAEVPHGSHARRRHGREVYRRESDKLLEEGLEEAFSKRELKKSREHGCGSCKVLEEIVKHLFQSSKAEDEAGDDEKAYLISRSFLVTETRLTSRGTGIRKVQLFNPKGTTPIACCPCCNELTVARVGSPIRKRNIRRLAVR
jgi:hypothetical protein